MNRINSVLILDNDPRAAHALGRLLELYCQSFYLTCAYTGTSAMYLACSGDFDIIVLDLCPGRDWGADAAKAIRSSCVANPPKLVAVSSDQRRVAIERGAFLFDHALAKPMIVEELFMATRCSQSSTGR